MQSNILILFSSGNNNCNPTKQHNRMPTNFVSEQIKNAKAALQNGTTEETLNQLDLAEEAIGVASEENE
jgi:hypothetical protein